VLFVGTDWFTKHYDRLFAASEYWTIEISQGAGNSARLGI
jgi:hypothetical protein